MTIAEFLALPNERDVELIEGEVRPRDKGLRAFHVSAHFPTKLSQYADAHNGYVFGGRGGYEFVTSSGESLWRTSVSYVEASRMPLIPHDFTDLAPDIAVEVIGPYDRYVDVVAKVRLCLDHGVRSVWKVDPSTRTVEVITAESRREFAVGDQLTDEAVLPGFECEVGRLFPA